MRILLTNDDGIYAPGLRALRKELQKLGEVVVVAPAAEQSAVGHSITLLMPLLVQEILDEHRRGRRDNSTHLWGLLTLELWHRAFIDRIPEPNFEGAKRIGLDRLAVNPTVVAEGFAR